MPRGARRAPTIVVLVRHGKTSTTGVLLPGRRPGLHLDDEGRRQADAAAQRLAKLPRIDAVYSSPLERARETAAPIARARGLSVRTERGLLEIDVGAWAGLKLDRARKKPEWAIVQRHATGFRFPNGESFLEMQTRVVGHSPIWSPVIPAGRSSPSHTPIRSRRPSPTRSACISTSSSGSPSDGVDHGGGLRGRRPARADGQRDGRRPRRSRSAMSASFAFDAPDHFTVGAVGQPGKRTFYLQGRQAETLVTLKCEKEQVGALAEYVAGLLVRLKTMDRPAAKDMPLLEPVDSLWDVGAVGVGYDEQADRILVVANEAVEEATTEDEAAEEESASGRPRRPSQPPGRARARASRSRGTRRGPSSNAPASS